MSASPQFLQIPFSEVFKRINAGTLVVTPNQRLALAFKAQFDQFQIDHNAVAWQAIDVLAFSTLVERLYTNALYSVQSFDWPLLLSEHQEQVLWEAIIQNSPAGQALLRITQTAQKVKEAWQLAHAWYLVDKLKQWDLNEDGQAFLGWAQSYQEITAHNRQIESSRLCDLITKQYDVLDIDKPAALICHGFTVFTPQQIAFLEKLASAGCTMMVVDFASRRDQTKQTLQRAEYANSREEIVQAAIWARDKLESNQSARIGIVVPELTRCRGEVMRVFGSVMHPDVRVALPGAKRPVAPFNVSLGVPLTSYPLIDDALTTLMLVDRQLDYFRVSHWIRSPFLAGSESEMEQRALLDAQLCRYVEPTITLRQLISLLQQMGTHSECSLLWSGLSALWHFQQTNLPQTASHAIFAGIFQEILKIMGFPGERSIDSIEYQTIEKWRALLTEFAALDHVRIQISYREAVDRLRRMASDTVFQPETASAPIQILGVLEAAGMQFDHLWVMGLSDECWPLRARPNPFLPFQLQSNAKLPLASTQEALSFCKKLTDGWMACAEEVIFSSPQFSDDRDGHVLESSFLIRAIPKADPSFQKFTWHRDRIAASIQLQRIEDDQTVSGVDGEMIKGGTAVVKDFAACSFRAFARYRLAIDRIAEPHAGLDAMERGSLVHQVLAQVWSQLKTKTMLDAMTDSALEELLETIAASAISDMRCHRSAALSDRAAAIEKRRLVRLVQAWLGYERKRNPFTVVATEERRSILIGNLHLNARLDRVDELENGQHLVIDYKTKKQSIAGMFGERPDEPQLPLYLVTTEDPQHAAGAVFATIKQGEMGFAAIVRDEGTLPEVKAYYQINGGKDFASWNDLLATWRQNLTRLADGFCSGDARVNPKRLLTTCTYCDLHLFCRIYERIGDREINRSEEEMDD